MNFFDPACGCGNFLIIAYRELRELEMEVIRELRVAEAQRELDVAELSRASPWISSTGSNSASFPARIAETALWMMDHIMNNRLSLEFGQTYTRIPLTTSPHILCADALETDWAEFLPPGECSYRVRQSAVRGRVLSMTDRGEAGAGERTYRSNSAEVCGHGWIMSTAWFFRKRESIFEGSRYSHRSRRHQLDNAG